MNILVIGSGGREHAIVWKFRQSRDVREVFCSPGNGGIGADARLLPACAEGDWASVAEMARRYKIDLTFVGPEAPLGAGIVDFFREKGLRIVGPDRRAAQLECSKAFAKEFMRRHGLPTADFEVFEDAGKALDYCRARFKAGVSLVVKADGLAAGKGVTVCDTVEEAEAAVRSMMVEKVFGAAGNKVLIEERLSGDECSLMAFCDGKFLQSLPPARDHKRVFDGDKGPNTGGMGAVCPYTLPPGQLDQITRAVLLPFLKGLQKDGLDYRGIIYFGLMLTPKGPQVLEFNVRFGDPETQAVLPLVESDLAAVCDAVIDQKLDKVSFKVPAAFSFGVVCASGGYPGTSQKHKKISGLKEAAAEGALVFHAGTTSEGGEFYTSGGRVLSVVAKAASFAEAREKCYRAVGKVHFEGMHYRKDIGSFLFQPA